MDREFLDGFLRQHRDSPVAAPTTRTRWIAQWNRVSLFLTNDFDRLGLVDPDFYSTVCTKFGVLRNLIEAADVAAAKDSFGTNDDVESQSTAPEVSNATTDLNGRIEITFHEILQLLQGSVPTGVPIVPLWKHMPYVDIEFQDSLTLSTLWTLYEEQLYRSLLARQICGHTTEGVVIVVRNVLTQKSRLSSLQKRLIAANCLRREKILIAKYSIGNLTTPIRVNSVHHGVKGTSQQRGDDAAIEQYKASEPLWEPVAPKVNFVATRFKYSPPVDRTLDDREYPKPPIVAGRGVFVCPYCAQTLPARIAMYAREWRKHVRADVLPYTCIFEECSTPFLLYDSPRQWLAHMENDHSRPQWVCYGCSPSEPRTFDSRQEYWDHFDITKEHIRVPTNPQRETLCKLNEVSRPLKFSSCPLCRWNEASDTTSLFGNTLQQHIQDHVFSFGMCALPGQSSEELSHDTRNVASIAGTPSQFGDTSSDTASDSSSVSPPSRTSQSNSPIISVNIDNRALDMGSRSHYQSVNSVLLWSRGVVSSKRLTPQWSRSLSISQVCAAFLALLAKVRRRGERRWPKVLVSIRSYVAFMTLRNTLQCRRRTRWSRVLASIKTCAALALSARKARAKTLCRFCREVTSFFEELDVEAMSRTFPYHQSRHDMHSHGRSGCSMCKMLMQMTFGDDDQTNLDKLDAAAAVGDETMSFVFRGGSDDKRLQLVFVSNYQAPLCEFEIYCDQHAPLSVGLNWTKYRSRALDPSSHDTLYELRNLLKTCRGGHHLCRTERKKLPTRLLDVGSPDGKRIRIIETHQLQDQPDFTFLSATWGTEAAISLTSANFDSLHLAIDFEVLPKTIRDAILIARALDVRFIWVASLCVIQDSVQDSGSEAARLDTYIQSCVFTLAAANSLSLANGFLNFRKDPRCYSFPLSYNHPLWPTDIHLRKCGDSLLTRIFREPLLQRGWALQELTLCPRLMIWGSHDVVWNCRTLMASDTSTLRETSIWNQLFGLDKLHPTIAAAAISTKEVEQPDRELIYKSWHSLVEFISETNLRIPADRLPSVKAFASMMARNLKDEYFAGHWRHNFLGDLMWHKHNAPLVRTRRTKLPSWSWAAYTGKISYAPLMTLDQRYLPGFTDSREVVRGFKFYETIGDDGIIPAVYLGTWSIAYPNFLKRWRQKLDWQESWDTNPDLASGHQGMKVRFTDEVDVDAPERSTSDVTLLMLSSTRLNAAFLINFLLVKTDEHGFSHRVGVGALLYRGPEPDLYMIELSARRQVFKLA